MAMADKIVVMHDGNVEQIGAPLDLYDHPANLFVAGFIGSPAMNFIEGRVSLNGTARFISEAGVELPLNGAPGARDGQSAIRSEKHTSELQSLMRISYAVLFLKKKTN